MTTTRALATLFALALPVLACAQSDSLALEQRLLRVEDELAIRKVLIDYPVTQDAHDYDGYAALFALEGEWVYGPNVYKGRAAIKQMLIDLYGPTPPGYINGESVHISFNAEVIIDGDRATAHTRHLLLMRSSTTGLPEPMLHGRYDDELIREDGEWKILRRVDTPVIPTYDEWNRIIRERLTTGTR